MAELSRRAFLAGAAAIAAAGCRSGDDDDGAVATTTTAPTPTTALVDGPPELPADIAAVEIATDPFTLGVASGDPDDSSVVLWTRLAPDPFEAGAGLPADATELAVELAPDDTFTTGVRAGRFGVDVERGHAVHAVVDGLDPATAYRYRFRIGAWTSTVGTTRTTPEPHDATTPLALGVASCQRYDDGAFAAHRDLAAAGVDLVAFVGDYVYESPTGGQPVRPLPGPRGDADAVDLTGYRDRYVAARLDPHLAAAHAACPWVVTWDDHEVRNNPAGHQVEAGRRAAAYQAWWEHQPVRLPPPPADGGPYPIARSVRWGRLAELVALDLRQFRSEDACGGGLVTVAECPELDDPARTMLGADQEASVESLLATDDPPAWTLLASSVVLAPIRLVGRVNADAWDGYPAARTALLADLAAAGRTDTVVLTGDIHVALVADVTDDAGTVVATELVSPSVSSRIADVYTDVVPLLPIVSPEVVHAADHRGWLRCDIGPDRVDATYLAVARPADPESPVAPAARFAVDRGSPGARTV